MMNNGEHKDNEKYDLGGGVIEIKLVCEQMKKNLG